MQIKQMENINGSIEDFCFFDDPNHPLSRLITALASCVHPKIIASACKAALEAHHQLHASSTAGDNTPTASIDTVVKGVSSAIAAVSVIAKERSEQHSQKMKHMVYELVAKQNKKIETKLKALNEMEQTFNVERDRLQILTHSLIQDRVRFQNDVKMFNHDLAVFKNTVSNSNTKTNERPAYQSVLVDHEYPSIVEEVGTIPNPDFTGPSVKNLPTPKPITNYNEQKCAENPSVNSSPSQRKSTNVNNVAMFHQQPPLDIINNPNYAQMNQYVSNPSGSGVPQFLQYAQPQHNMNMPVMMDKNQMGGQKNEQATPQINSSIQPQNTLGNKFNPNSNSNASQQFMLPTHIQPQMNSQHMNRPNIRFPIISNIQNVQSQIEPDQDMSSIINRDGMQQANPMFFNVQQPGMSSSMRNPYYQSAMKQPLNPQVRIPSNQNQMPIIDPLKEQLYLQQQLNMIINQCNSSFGGNNNNPTSDSMMNPNVQQSQGVQMPAMSFSPINPMGPLTTNPSQNMPPFSNVTGNIPMAHPSRQQLPTTNEFMMMQQQPFNTNMGNMGMGPDIGVANSNQFRQQFVNQQNMGMNTSQANNNNFSQPNIQHMKTNMPPNANVNQNSMLSNFNQPRFS